MAFELVLDWIRRPLSALSKEPLHRQLLIISGTHASCHQRARQLVAALPCGVSCCALGADADFATLHYPAHQYTQVLGQEHGVVIYDGFSDFRPNAILALTGTLQQAGTFILLCPPLNQWPGHGSVTQPHFLSYGSEIDYRHSVARFASALGSSSAFGLWQDDEVFLPAPQPAPERAPFAAPFKTSDQQQAFDDVLEAVAAGAQMITLCAPRGRGKSALLGLLARHWARQGLSVALTSPLKSATHSFFTLLGLDNSQTPSTGCREFIDPRSGAAVRWLAPDNPALNNPDADILLIDEAAALPLPLLKKLCATGLTTILSTTTSGYEGSGQGFVTRLLPWLQQHFDTRALELKQPVRWLSGDPLEQCLAESLLYESNKSAIAQVPEPASHRQPDYHFGPLSALDEQSLQQVMTLLRSAHYQTTPDDLMRLNDAPDCICVTQKSAGKVVGAAIINIEGGESLQPVAGDIAKGKRRVKGHLGAQSLALMSASEEIATARLWRINRIAVAPHLQGQGLGSQLLTAIQDRARVSAVDGIVSAFGVRGNLLNFWHRNGFMLLKRGHKPDKASGQISVTVGLSVNQFPVNYLQQLGQYDEAFGYSNNNGSASAPGEPSALPLIEADADLHRRRAQQFCAGFRTLEQLGGSGYWLLTQPQNESVKGHLTDTLLCAVLIERQPKNEVIKRFNLGGAKALQTELRTALRTVLEAKKSP